MYVRAMTEVDLPAVQGLCGELGYPVGLTALRGRFTALDGDPAHWLGVAQDAAGRVVGFVHVYARPTLESDPQATVQALAVARAHRRGGAGRALLDAAEAWAGRQGLALVGLHCNVRRRAAHRFYERTGYAAEARSTLFRKRLRDG